MFDLSPLTSAAVTWALNSRKTKFNLVSENILRGCDDTFRILKELLENSSFFNIHLTIHLLNPCLSLKTANVNYSAIYFEREDTNWCYVCLDFLNVEESQDTAQQRVFLKQDNHIMTNVFQKIQAQYLSNHIHHRKWI